MKVWKSAETKQAYLLPTNLVWEQESELADYVVTDEEMEAYVEAQLKSAWRQVEGAFSNLAASLTNPKPDRERLKSSELSPDATANGKSLVESLLGVTAERAQANPDAVTDSVNAIFGNLKTFVNSVLADDEADLLIAQAQMADLQQTLNAHDIPVNDTLQQLPRKLNTAYVSAKQQAQRVRVADMDGLAAQVEKLAYSITDALREHSAELSSSQPPN